MLDVVYVAVILVFFAIAAVFVRACERILGPDLEAGSPADAQAAAERPAA
jgi:hypothetical protein